jgi:hypothetical protein
VAPDVFLVAAPLLALLAPAVFEADLCLLAVLGAVTLAICIFNVISKIVPQISVRLLILILIGCLLASEIN